MKKDSLHLQRMLLEDIMNGDEEDLQVNNVESYVDLINRIIKKIPIVVKDMAIGIFLLIKST
jgi:hypothetical protein